MAEVNGNFDFSKYDVGGTGATAGDGKLSGEEARNARADGWTIWDGYTEEDGTPSKIAPPEPKGTLSTQDFFNKIKGTKLSDLLDRFHEVFPPAQTEESSETDEDLSVTLTKLQHPEKVKEARAELEDKEYNGIKYKDAKAKIEEIQQKYSKCFKMAMSKDTKIKDMDDFMPRFLPKKKSIIINGEKIELPDNNSDPGFDGTMNAYIEKPNFEDIGFEQHPMVKKQVFVSDMLPEPAKTEYKEARAAINEIERNNAELVKLAGKYENNDKGSEDYLIST